MEPVTFIATFFGALKNGFDLVDKKKQNKIEFSLSADWYGIDGQYKNHLLIHVHACNKSPGPYSIRSIDLVLNGVECQPAYIESVSMFSVEIVKVNTASLFHLFQKNGLRRFNIFPDNAYLEHNQTVSGLLLYALPENIGELTRAAIRLRVAGYNYALEHELIG